MVISNQSGLVCMVNGAVPNIFEVLDKISYKEWKMKRYKVISALGKSILKLNDKEISSTFNNIEDRIKKSLENATELSIVRSLLCISILYHFRRSIDHLTSNFSTIIEYVNTKNITIAQIYAKFFYYTITEAENFQPFLNQTLNIVNHMLSNENKENYTVNAFFILQQLSKIESINILNVTVKHVQDLTASVCSNNQILRKIGRKLFKIHLRLLPEELSSKFANDKFNICIQMLFQFKNRVTQAPILLMHAIFKAIPHILSLNQLSEVIYQVLPNTTPEMQLLFFKFIRKVIKIRPNEFDSEIIKFILDQIQQLINQSQNIHDNLKTLHIIVSKMSENALNFKLIEEILEFIIQNQLFDEYELVYSISNELIAKFPKEELKPIFFENPQPNIQFLSLIKQQPKVFDSVSDILRAWIVEGINDENDNELNGFIAIEILKLYGVELFWTTSGVIEQLMLIARSQNEKLRISAIQTMPIIDSKNASPYILQFAIYDPSKNVRLEAIKLLDAKYLENDMNQLIFLLADKSLKVCIESLPIIAEIFNTNPILFETDVFNYIYNFVTNYMPVCEFSKLIKACKMLSNIISYFKNVCSTIAPIILWTCTTILLEDEKIQDFSQLENDFDPKIFVPQDLNKYETKNASFASSFKEKGSYWKQIFNITHGKNVDNRNAALFDTISSLSEHVVPFILHIGPVFIKYFNSSHSQVLYESALQCLTKITISTECKFKLTTMFPKLLSSIINLINSNVSGKIVILALRLIGTIGSPDSIPLQTFNENKVSFTKVTMSNPSFFSDFTINLLVSILSKSKSVSVFEVITTILAKGTSFTMKYLEIILIEFRKAIQAEIDVNLLFKYLEVVIYSIGWHISKYIDQFTEVLKKNILKLDCLNLCITLSHKLRSGFTNIASQLYPIVLMNYNTNDVKLLKKLTKFATFSVMYQNQSFFVLLDSIESNFLSPTNPAPKQKITIIIKRLTMLVQHFPLHNYGVQIAQIAFRLLKHHQTKDVLDLIVNLCLFANIDVKFAEQATQMLGCQLPHAIDIQDHLNLGKPIIEQILFINDIIPRINTTRILQNIKEPDPPSPDVFSNLSIPYYNNMDEWFLNLEIPVIRNSPNVFIRACSVIITKYPEFRHDLFPVAFLSCWINESEESKQNISSIIESCLIKFEPSGIGQILPYLANILDRYGTPFLIPDSILSIASNSAALSLYQIERSLNTKSLTINERLLSLNTRIGRIETARSLLKHSMTESAKWHEKLGEWEKALEIHSKDDVSSLIRCYSNLEQWEKVREFDLNFENLDDKEKQERALWFAYAYLHENNLEKASYYINYLKKISANTNESQENENILRIIVSALYYISIRDYESANSTIEDGFQFLAKNRSIFNGSDANIAHKYLIASQHFIELYECILHLTKKSKRVPRIWSNRIENYVEESDAWKRLIDIRLLVLSPEDTVETCAKMIAALRKERKWIEIDSYLSRLKSVSDFPNIIIERIKINWSRGNKFQAIDQMDQFAKLLSANSPEEVKLNEFFTNMTKEEIFSLISRWNIDDKLKSRVFRISATWKFSCCKKNFGVVESFEKCTKLNDKDSRAWSGWAYSCSKMLSEQVDQKTYAINAIAGFLKASKLNPSASLQFLCQIFSIFVRYCDSFSLPSEIREEIITLNPSFIIQIIPQIIFHVTHPSHFIRDIIDEIVTKFGEDHFEAVVYPLSVISNIQNDREYQAKDVMNRLSLKNMNIFNDSKLFIDGMVKSAVSWCERWISILNSLNYAKGADEALKIINVLFNEKDENLCEFDLSLKHFHKKLIDRSHHFYSQVLKGEKTYMQPMWEMLQNLMRDIQAKINDIDAIYLSKISPDLCNKKNFLISVPGLYNINKQAPKLNKIEERLELFSTLNHPRLLNVVDENGTRHKFLLKGNEDLRLDQRIMQIFSLANSLIKVNRSTRMNNISITMYSVVPFAPNTGLISWVNGADTISQIVSDYRNSRKKAINQEKQIFHEFASLKNNTLNAIQSIELHDLICQKTSADELRENLWLWSSAPAQWVDLTRNFTLSTALMSMIGYIIGLGDRHLRNIMVQKHTGCVVHIDFGECFESASNRTIFPEKVPFRLTRLFTNAIEGRRTDGIFTNACGNYMYVIREGFSSVIAMLEVFVHEPIFSSRSQFKDQTKILSRVAEKMSGLDFAYGGDSSNEMSVIDQVQILIEAATDRTRYCRHYQGWQPQL